MASDRAMPIEMTTICMVIDGKNVLMQNRIDEDWPGLVFPGGHVESYEAVVEAAIREVYEETGITPENPKLCGIQDWEFGEDGRYLVFFFKATKFHGEVRSSDEGEAVWVPIDDLPNRKLAHNFDKLLRVFNDDNVSEMYHPDGEWDCRYL